MDPNAPLGPEALSIQQLQSQPQYAQLLTPEKIAQISPAPSKQQMVDGATQLWNVLRTKPANDPSHQNARQRLLQLSHRLIAHAKSQRQQQQQNPTGASPSQQQPVAQPPPVMPPNVPVQNTNNAPQPQVQQPQPGAGAPNQPGNARPLPDVPQEYMTMANSINFLVPQNQKEPQQWIAEMRRRYAMAHFRIKSSTDNKRKLQEMAQQAQAQGRNITAEFQQRNAEFDRNIAESQTFIKNLKQQQEQLRSQQAAGQAGDPSAQAAQNRPPGQQQPPAPNAQVEAARQQANRPPSSPQVPGGVPFPAQRAMSGQINQAQTQSPQSATPAGGQPQAFTHEQAINAANKSYSSTASATQATPAGQPSNSQSLQRPEVDKYQRNPNQMQKNFSMPPPTPAQMGASRPTLMAPSNGPAGMIGQPAITQTPTFNLHGQGDHVLERGKLHELVRQVTGAGDGQVGEHQGLSPEVEESVLMLADEFIDNVVTAACKLAKLRGSTTLELRDIQLVLERQYNIRIPGYGLDETRTVRKVQPAPAFYQKLNAINAAKVVGKASDV